MLVSTLKNWKTYPVTVSMIFVSSVLWAATLAWDIRKPPGADTALRTFGAVTTLVRLGLEPGAAGPERIKGSQGFYDLWDGEVWRIPFNAFHHQQRWPLHLISNCIVLWWLGRPVERRLGSWLYAIFFLSAAVISMIPDLWLEHDVVGLSGVIFGVFGFIVVVRQFDQELAEEVSDRAVRFLFAWLVFCLFLTDARLLPVANAAHATGLVYGMLLGGTYWCIQTRRWHRLATAGFVALHASIVPTAWYLMHPVDNGRYHWYQSGQTADRRERIDLLEKAVRLEPGLGFAWQELAGEYKANRQYANCWTALVNALASDRSSQKLLQLCADGRMLFEREGHEIPWMEILKRVFGDEAAAWERRIAQARPREIAIPVRRKASDAARLEILSGESLGARQHDADSAPQFDPDRFDSAMEGVPL